MAPTSRPTNATLTPKGLHTRLRIVSAAAELMLDRGVAGTTIEDIREVTGASTSQIYHYFAGKQDLVRAVIEFQTDTVVGGQEAILASLDSQQGLRAWRDHIVEHQRRTDCRGGCPLGSLGSELAETDAEARSAVAASYTRWETGIRSGLRSMQEHGHLDPDADPDGLALAMLAAMQGGLLLTKVQRTTRPLEVALDAMLTLIASSSTAIPATTPPRPAWRSRRLVVSDPGDSGGGH
jgi:AcrR family transcriptional regulator